MYKQFISNIKVVIIPLDGVVFDLNRYRYNYYHHLCDSKHIQLDKQDFYSHLSNMYDMYKELPLSGKVDPGPLNAKIERELSQYLHHKGLKPKEGFLELLEYLHQKKIQIAIMSTHRTKDAVSYLQMTKLYNKVHFIIGSDTSSLPLPSTQILETIRDYFDVKSEEVLVLSSFMSLNNAANQLQMNVIYCEDLVPASLKEKETSYKTVTQLFEVLNILLFDQYEEAQMYSPILGMNSHMTHDELEEVRDKLQETYQDDPEIIQLVDQTYAYHVSQLGQQTIKDASTVLNPISQNKPSRQFSFEDDLSEDVAYNVTDLELENSKIVQESQNESDDIIHLSPLDQESENELTALLQQINKPQEVPTKKVTEYEDIKHIVESSIEEDEIDEDDEESNILKFLVNVLYIFAVSFLILFIGLIIYVAFVHQFEEGTGIFRIVTLIYNVYYHMIEVLFQGILNTLHQIISFVPSYQEYEMTNAFFSVEGVRFFNIFLFHAFVIGLVKTVMFIIQRRSIHEIID